MTLLIVLAFERILPLLLALPGLFLYLGRYTHPIAISNARLEAFAETGVRFRTGKART